MIIFSSFSFFTIFRRQLRWKKKDHPMASFCPGNNLLFLLALPVKKENQMVFINLAFFRLFALRALMREEMSLV